MYFCISNSDMYEQEFQGDILYMMLYAVVAALNLVACCYLLFRRGNAFAPDITSPMRLRRWTAVFFAANTLCHLWYLPTYFLTSSDDRMLGYLIAGLLDSMTVIPLMTVILLVMLQDRRRPLWPVAMMVAPPVVGLAWCIANRSDAVILVLRIYFLLLTIGLIIYIIRALRQYGRWLRDNYADLEHKEVWQSFVVLGIILLVYVVYSLDSGELIYEYVMEVIVVILICYLLWRVETLSDLSLPVDDAEEACTIEGVEDNDLPLSIRSEIEFLLQRHCIDEQDTSYNAYINDLRVNHFVRLHREAVAAQRSFTAQQLAQESGFNSYRTFSDVFKRKTGQNVTAWIKAASEQEQSQARLDSAEREQLRPEGKAAGKAQSEGQEKT